MCVVMVQHLYPPESHSDSYTGSQLTLYDHNMGMYMYIMGHIPGKRIPTWLHTTKNT